MHSKVLALAGVGGASLLAYSVQADAQASAQPEQATPAYPAEQAPQDSQAYQPRAAPPARLYYYGDQVQPYEAPPAGAAPGRTLTCKLTSGPGAGTSFYFEGTPDAPARAGVDCTDLSGSRGVTVIPGNESAGQPSWRGEGRYYQSWGPQGAVTFACLFTTGPRTGTSVDFAQTPGSAAVPVGGGCADGAGSTGVAVAPTLGQREQDRYGPY